MEQTSMRNFIPKENLVAHEYCFFLHDILAGLVVEGEKERIFDYRFELKSPDHARQMRDKSGEALSAWMEQNGYEAELREANRRHICVALLSDFCHFIYEALECSRKGKLTVAFALLRKPLKENLFYFEWLLADPSDFVNRFHAPVSINSRRPLPLPTELSKPERLKIIRKAIKNTELATWISPEFVYELRYDKTCNYGFEGLFQRANHLITTFTAQTEEQNFNFVFSGEEEKKSQWRGLYTILPSLLLHSVTVIGAIIRGFDSAKLKDFDFLNLRAQVGYLLYLQSGTWNIDLRQIAEDFLKHLAQIGIPCLDCQNIIVIDAENLRKLYLESAIKCQQCGYTMPFTSNRKLLLLSHLAQEKLNCPNCGAIILANADNVKMYAKSNQIKCQECNEEIEMTTGEND